MCVIHDSLVIGAGQGGLASSYALKRRGIEYVVLDRDSGPGGAWQHRWDALTMDDVHGVADLPDSTAPGRSPERANVVIPEYFGEYESEHDLPVERPVKVMRVEAEDGARQGPLVLTADDGRTWRTRTLVNATGTWTRPFVPAYPGASSFAGEQFHTVTYPGPEHFRGKRVAVIGGGASAVQFIGQIAPIADIVWVTRREPVWRDGFDGLEVVTGIEERAVQGLPTQSVVSGTALSLRPQEYEASRLGAYDRRLPMFERIEPEGLRWADGRFERVDILLWATGFRPAIDHLSPLHLRSSAGGIALERVPGNVQGATTAALDPRIHFVGYGPSASTIGASRAARQAARAVEKYLAEDRSRD